jgi:hypothetical protein
VREQLSDLEIDAATTVRDTGRPLAPTAVDEARATALVNLARVERYLAEVGERANAEGRETWQSERQELLREVARLDALRSSTAKA